MGICGPLRASTHIYVHLLASHGPLMANVGLNWPLMGLTLASHGSLPASTCIFRPLMGLFGPHGPSTGLAWATWATTGHTGLSWTYSCLYAHLLASHGPLMATVGLNWPLKGLTLAFHGPLRASTDFNNGPSTGLA